MPSKALFKWGCTRVGSFKGIPSCTFLAITSAWAMALRSQPSTPQLHNPSQHFPDPYAININQLSGQNVLGLCQNGQQVGIVQEEEPRKIQPTIGCNIAMFNSNKQWEVSLQPTQLKSCKESYGLPTCPASGNVPRFAKQFASWSRGSLWVPSELSRWSRWPVSIKNPWVSLFSQHWHILYMALAKCRGANQAYYISYDIWYMIYVYVYIYTYIYMYIYIYMYVYTIMYIYIYIHMYDCSLDQ